MPQEILPTRAFQLTVSVKGDLSVESQEELTKWIRKNTLMHYIVIETGESGRRHMHALMIFKDPRDPRKIKDNVWTRMVKPWHEDSIARIAVKVQVCPGNKWYQEYLQKESTRELISNTWNEEDALEFYPEPAVQEALMAKSRCKEVACPWLEQDVSTWTGSTFENTPEGALMYLNSRMYDLRNMVPISDPRKITQKALMYWKYRNRVISPTERELFYLKELQDGPSFDANISHVSGGAPGNSKKLWKDKDFSDPSSI